VAKALRAGADDYIRKPFRFEEMLARIEASLRVNHLHKDLVVANEKLQKMVELDYLTGLFNMRSMYDKIDYELKRGKRFGRSVSCIMMDMDHFKTVNDTNDHLFGSFVLKETGEIIKSTMREIDFAARYGGDEFLIVLTETNQNGTMTFCNRLRENIENHTFDDGRNQMNLTVSLGFAIAEGDEGLDARSLVRLADHALYDAKEAGRNRVSVYTGDKA
jgi:diguanylate cyclase (GGDEF)-like protein